MADDTKDATAPDEDAPPPAGDAATADAADPPDDTATAVAEAPAGSDGATDDGTSNGDAPADGADDENLSPDEIEALLAAADEGNVQLPAEEDGDDDDEGAAADAPASGPAVESHSDSPQTSEDSPAASPGPAAETAIPVGGQVEKLLEEVEAEFGRSPSPVVPAGTEVPGDLGTPTPLRLEALAPGVAGAGGGDGTLGVLDDVELDLRIELGRTEMRIEEVVGLRDGSVVALDKLAGDPVDILVNGRLIARGEVLVLNDNFCVRVAEILATEG